MTLALLVLTAAALAASWLVLRRGSRRQSAVARLLDAADALETRLRTARVELEAITGDDHAVREAMQEMLRQRLWLQQHGGEASLEQIVQVRQSLEDARDRIDQQLLRIQRARAQLG